MAKLRGDKNILFKNLIEQVQQLKDFYYNKEYELLISGLNALESGLMSQLSEKYRTIKIKEIHELPEWLQNQRESLKDSYIETHVNKKVYFYILKFYSTDETFIKVGISSNLKFRYSNQRHYQYAILYKIPLMYNIAWDLESNILGLLYKKSHYYRPKKEFTGFTECFKSDSFDEIMRYIEKCLK